MEAGCPSPSILWLPAFRTMKWACGVSREASGARSAALVAGMPRFNQSYIFQTRRASSRPPPPWPVPCQSDAARLDEEAGFTYSANLGCLDSSK